MSSPVEKALESLKEADAQIAALQKKRNDLAQFISLYRRLFDDGEVSEGINTAPISPAKFLDTFDPAPHKPAKSRIEEAVKEILFDGSARHTRVLLEMLSERGIEVGGKDKVIALSSILSRNKNIFESSRKIGWSLKEERSENVRAPSDLV